MAMHVAALPEELRLQIEDSLGLVRTRWFDTHPSPADRIQRARQAADDGIFHRTEPAGCLFSNFEVICKQATLSCYRDELGLPVTAHNMVPVGDAAPSSDASE
jgi:hypothetical protein